MKKNQVDGVRSTAYVPLRDILGFIAVINETIRPYLAAKGHSAEEVEKMHRAWCKSHANAVGALGAAVHRFEPGAKRVVIPSPKRRDVLGRPLIQRDGILPEDAFRGISDGGETAFANRRGRVRRELRSPLPICLWAGERKPTSQNETWGALLFVYLGWKMAMVRPVGSAMTVNHPTLGISCGPTWMVAPSARAFSVETLMSSTPT